MDRLIYTALAGINEQRPQRQVEANDLANVSTVGFKKSFDQALIAIKTRGDGYDTRIQPQSRTTDRINLEPGARMVTNKALDIAMDNKTVMGVQAPNGELAFTRRGDLRINNSGILENGQGHIVLSEEGTPINVPLGFQITVTRDGTIVTKDPTVVGVAPNVEVAQILIREAKDAFLVRREDGLFKAIGENVEENGDFESGEVVPSVTSGVLEGSNVNPIHAMINLIEHERDYESQVRFIKEAKTIDESGTTMMRNN